MDSWWSPRVSPSAIDMVTQANVCIIEIGRSKRSRRLQSETRCALRGEAPDLFVRAGNDSMVGAGVGRGDLVAISQNREPEHGDLVAALPGSPEPRNNDVAIQG